MPPRKVVQPANSNRSNSRQTDLWKVRGEEDVAYQRQAQVSWWTLLGGIAVAALLTQVESLVSAFQSGRWFYILYFLATCLIIINAWTQTSWGALVLHWPISVPSSIIIFIGGISLSLAALNVTRPWLWFAAASSVLIFAQLMQYTFKTKAGWVALPADAVKRANIGILIYWLLVLVTVASSVILLIFTSPVLELAFGILAFLLSVAALYWQHIGMESEKKRMGIA